jgi:hypothetical protein
MDDSSILDVRLGEKASARSWNLERVNNHLSSCEHNAHTLLTTTRSSITVACGTIKRDLEE